MLCVFECCEENCTATATLALQLQQELANSAAAAASDHGPKVSTACVFAAVAPRYRREGGLRSRACTSLSLKLTQSVYLVSGDDDFQHFYIFDCHCTTGKLKH